MKSTYYHINICINCEKRLSEYQIMYSEGTCKFCGNTNNSTIVDTKKLRIKQTRINPIWMFWKKQFKREAINQ